MTLRTDNYIILDLLSDKQHKKDKRKGEKGLTLYRLKELFSLSVACVSDPTRLITFDGQQEGWKRFLEEKDYKTFV